MNKFRKSERLSGLLAGALSGFFYVTAGALFIFLAQRSAVEQPPALSSSAVNLSFAQIELKTASSPEPAPAPVPPPEPAEVALKEIRKAPEPEPQPEAVRPDEVKTAQVSSEAQTAQVVQESAAPATLEAAVAVEPMTGSAQNVNWQALAIAKVRAMVEREKYYPPAAQKAGYTGRVSVRIRLEPDGTVSGYEVKESRGHPLLSRAVETTMSKIQGRNIGMALPEQFDILLPIEFELK